MRNGGIGRGWYEDENTQDDLCQLAVDLLKEKITEVFTLISNNKEKS